MFGGVAPGMQQEEKKEEGIEPTPKGGGRIVSNPIDLDEVPSDLSSIANDNDGKGDDNNNDGEAAAAVIVEERLLASAKAEAARAALWKQAANKNDTTNSCGGGRAVVVDNDNDDEDDNADIFRLNRINTAMFERINAKQQRQEQMDMVVARETTGVSAATGLTTSGDGDGDASAAADRRVVREQSLTGSYTDVSENFMMESFLFLNRDDRNNDGDDDDDDDGGEEKKEGNQSAGTPATKTAANMDDKNNDDIIAAQDVDFFTEDDEYGNCKITCDEHMINRIDDIVCSSAVCSALPEQFLGGEDDDDDDDLEEGAQGDL